MSHPEAPERQPRRGPLIEILSPRHFYAAYIFDRAESRREDVGKVLEHAGRLGYLVRYWWLSQAMDLMGAPDRLIVCVHHPEETFDAGMDLFQALRDEQAAWDDLEAAALDEYLFLGRPVAAQEALLNPYDQPLYPPLQDINF